MHFCAQRTKLRRHRNEQRFAASRREQQASGLCSPERPARRWFHRHIDSTTVESMPDIRENLERVRDQIASAARKSARSADDIELIAISKTHDAQRVREAHAAGQNI